jgi:hypothetical protein
MAVGRRARTCRRARTKSRRQADNERVNHIRIHVPYMEKTRARCSVCYFLPLCRNPLATTTNIMQAVLSASVRIMIRRRRAQSVPATAQSPRRPLIPESNRPIGSCGDNSMVAAMSLPLLNCADPPVISRLSVTDAPQCQTKLSSGKKSAGAATKRPVDWYPMK